MAKASNLLKTFLLAAHPVGSYYWSSDSTSPAVLFGGSWEQIKDKFIYAAGAKSVDTTGGEESHTLNGNELPSVPICIDGNINYPLGVPNDYGAVHNSNVAWTGATTNSSGSKGYLVKTSYSAGMSHNNMPPYVVAYCWRRVA